MDTLLYCRVDSVRYLLTSFPTASMCRNCTYIWHVTTCEYWLGVPRDAVILSRLLSDRCVCRGYKTELLAIICCAISIAKNNAFQFTLSRTGNTRPKQKGAWVCFRQWEQNRLKVSQESYNLNDFLYDWGPYNHDIESSTG